MICVFNTQRGTCRMNTMLWSDRTCKSHNHTLGLVHNLHLAFFRCFRLCYLPCLGSYSMLVVDEHTVPTTGMTNVAFELNLLTCCWFRIQPDVQIVSNPMHHRDPQKYVTLGERLASRSSASFERVSLLSYSLKLR